MSLIREKYYRLLREYQAGYTGLAFFRPDTSGIRGKGVDRKAYQSGDDEFPYGDAEPNWGEPWAYSRDSAGHGTSHAPVPVPKKISDDDPRWADKNVDEMGTDGWLSGTPPQGNIVDDPGRTGSKFGIPNEEEYPPKEESRMEGLEEMERRLEALGVPFNSAKGGQGTGGQHTGGRVMPGTSGQWSSRPKGGQWDTEMSDDELDRAGDIDEFNYGLPFQGDITNRHQTTARDDDEENQIPEPRPMKGPSRFAVVGLATKHSRHLPGMTWKECTHRGLVEAFVSLKSIPQSEKQCSHSVDDVDLDFSKDSFRRARGAARQRFDTMDEPELVRYLIQIEPNHFLKSIGEIGKDRLIDIYEQWADDVLESDGGSMERMAERIMKAVGAER